MRLCPIHGTPLAETQELFPGSPSTAELWCLAVPGGHSCRSWLVQGSLSVFRQATRRAEPEARRIVKKLRRVVRNAGSHPWGYREGRAQ